MKIVSKKTVSFSTFALLLNGENYFRHGGMKQ